MKSHPINQLKNQSKKNPIVYWQALPQVLSTDWQIDSLHKKQQELRQNRSNESWNWCRNVEQMFFVTWLKAAFQVSSTEEFKQYFPVIYRLSTFVDVGAEPSCQKKLTLGLEGLITSVFLYQYAPEFEGNYKSTCSNLRIIVSYHDSSLTAIF